MGTTKTIFFLVQATTQWLTLSPKERDAFATRALRPILGRHPRVRLRYFDAEAYCADVSDVLMWEVESEPDYQALVEELRETDFWGRYFRVQQILATVEDGFAQHYGFASLGSERRA